MPEIQAGSLIAGRYTLESRLDAGGRAQVWRAVDAELARPVALKILVTPPGGDPAFIEAFRAEAQSEANLKHPNIVEVFDWGHDGEANYIVMELLAGRTLEQSLESQGPLGWELVLSIGRQISSALAYAHESGVAHGLISDERIILTPDGHATATGFGLQCRGLCETPPTPDADTHALGGVLYELLTGASPFAAAPAEHPENQPWPRPLHETVQGIPHELDRIIMKSIAPDVTQRYTGAAELQADLDALAKPKSHAALWWALAILAVLVAAAGTWFVMSRQNAVVPDVRGKTQAEATTILSAAHLKLVVAGQTASSEFATGTIATENPPAGSHVRRNAQVAVKISSGLPIVSVPSVTGIDLSSASSQIASAGLVVGTVTKQNSDSIPDGTVISSDPAAGTQVSIGTTVTLVVSAGQKTVTVPDVRGTSQSNATSKLESYGLKVQAGNAYSSSVAAGVVIDESPAAGTTVPSGSTVTLSVSLGPTPVVVPDVVTARQSEAVAAIQNANLVPVSTTESATTTYYIGRVMRTSPGAGTRVAPHSQVKLVIGK